MAKPLFFEKFGRKSENGLPRRRVSQPGSGLQILSEQSFKSLQHRLATGVPLSFSSGETGPARLERIAFGCRLSGEPAWSSINRSSRLLRLCLWPGFALTKGFCLARYMHKDRPNLEKIRIA